MSEWPHNAYKEVRVTFECGATRLIVERVGEHGIRVIDGHWFCPCDSDCKVSGMHTIDHNCGDTLFLWGEEQC